KVFKRWAGRIHNYLEFDPAAVHAYNFPDRWRIVEVDDAHRQKSRRGHEFEIRMLREEIAENPDVQRWWFYLERVLRGAGEMDEAKEVLRKVTTMDGWDQERYLAMLWLAHMERDPSWYCKALELIPARSEAYLWLGEHWLSENVLEGAKAMG